MRKHHPARGRAFLPVVALMLAVLTLSGCVSRKTVIALHPDGTGTITVTVLVNQTGLDMMQAMGNKKPGAQSEMQKALNIDEAALRGRAADFGEGVTLVSFKKIDGEGDGQGQEAVYAFTDVNRLTLGINEEACAEAGSPEALTLHYNGGILKVGLPQGKEYHELLKERFDDLLSIGDDQKPLMEGVSFELTLRVEGRTSGSNAKYPLGEEYGITLFRLDAGGLLKDRKLLEALAQTAPGDDDFQKLLTKTDLIKLETQPTITLRITSSNND